MIAKKWLITVGGFLCVAIFTGCATPLQTMQKMELRGYQAKGLEVKEKDPAVGAVLGILPGGGSFYTRNYGVGVCNFLLWPLSVLWDPVSGYQGSESINYYATKMTLSKQMRKELSAIEDEMTAGTIDHAGYIRKKREIETKYSPEFE